jgi:hypothetical protein
MRLFGIINPLTTVLDSFASKPSSEASATVRLRGCVEKEGLPDL